MALRQVGERGQQRLVAALAPVAGRFFGDHARHLVDPGLGLQRIGAGEQARQAGVGDGDVQAVGVVVGHVLPVHRPRAHHHRAQWLELLEAVGFDLGVIGGHHLGDAGQPGGKTHEHEAAPDLLLQRLQAQLGGVLAFELLPARDRRQPPVQAVAPGVVGADQPVAAVAGVSVGQARGAVAADIVETAHPAVLAADGQDLFVEDVKSLIVAGLGDVVDVADDLPALRKQLGALQLEEGRIGVQPGGQAFLDGLGHGGLRTLLAVQSYSFAEGASLNSRSSPRRRGPRS